MKQIEQKLRSRIGLDAGSIGSGLIERAVRLRMKEHSLERVEDYERLIENESVEWERLLESVVVTETWFFRDGGPFTALTRLVRDCAQNHLATPVRILSVPCSSGEEPYSIVMALLDAGISPNRFHVDAADISQHAITRAKAGVYGKNSFRGKDLAFRNRYFQPTNEGFLLDSMVRRSVSFYEANVLNRDFLQSKSGYDFIFCRNLLIYFDSPTQQTALKNVSRLLASSGVLFVGSAELPLALEIGFHALNLPMSFACTREPDVRYSNETTQKKTAEPVSILPQTGPVTATPTALNLMQNGNVKADTGALSRAKNLANAGRLVEAAAICQTHLDTEEPSAEGYYLLGLLRDASGDSSAIEWYRKALYLQPDHYETLVQMALLLDKKGEADNARLFRDRARRAKANGTKAPLPENHPGPLKS